MKNTEVNIANVQDKHYRYKMPKMLIKPEGGGNGKKTVMLNMDDIAEALGRPPTYITKFLSMKIGTNCGYADSQHIINGHRDLPSLTALLDEFIAKFVLCAKCKNPETVISVDKLKNVLMTCEACGVTTPADPREKLTNFIAKQPVVSKPAKQRVARVVASLAEEQATSSSFVPLREVNDDDWSEDVSEEAVKRRAAEEFAAGGGARMEHFQSAVDDEQEQAEVASPVDVLLEYLNEKPNASTERLLKVIAKLKKTYELGDKELVCLVCEAFFAKEADISAATIKKRAPIFKQLVTGNSAQKILLGYIELALSKHTAVIPKMSVLLHVFYEADILDEDTILAWAKSKKSRYVKDADALKPIKDAASVFVTWLKTADSDSDA